MMDSLRSAMDARSYVLLFVGCSLVALMVFGLTSKFIDNPDAGHVMRAPSFLADHMLTENLRARMERFQGIARMSPDGSRSILSPGYNASVTYVVNTLQTRTNFNVSVQHFLLDMSRVVDRLPSISISRPSSSARSLVYKTDFVEMGFTGGGFVESEVFVVKHLGCNQSDYAGLLPGQVALITRGVCAFADKAWSAIAAGAGAVLICNDGADSSRQGLIEAGVGKLAPVPIFFTSAAVGKSLKESPEPVHLALDIAIEVYPVHNWNVLAETHHGNNESVIVVGSHLDSVTAGGGLNDNGSGSATTLELAVQVYETGFYHATANRIRFAWWSAEEWGLLGSEHYVASLSDAERSRIACNVNLDMIGSPNYIRAVYDGRNATNHSIRQGSGHIQWLFESWFDLNQLAHVTKPFDGRSDYGPFIEKGIPAGGVATGAEVLKTAEEVRLFGGVLHAAHDPCYHLKCDTIDNVHFGVLTEMAKAAAHVVQTLALNEDLRTTLGYPLHKHQ